MKYFKEMIMNFDNGNIIEIDFKLYGIECV